MLEYGSERVHEDPYGNTYQWKSYLTNDEFWHAMYLDSKKEEKNRAYFHVVTRTYRHWWRWPKRVARNYDRWFMALDCDSLENLTAAVHLLKHDKIGHAVIHSSEGRYWVITDFVGTIKEVLVKMGQMPGLDQKYLQFCSRHQTVSIRALPRKPDEIQFPESHSLENVDVYQWFVEFRNHLESPEVFRYLKAVFIEDALQDGTLMEHAADPNFEV